MQPQYRQPQQTYGRPPQTFSSPQRVPPQVYNQPQAAHYQPMRPQNYPPQSSNQIPSQFVQPQITQRGQPKPAVFPQQIQNQPIPFKSPVFGQPQPQIINPSQQQPQGFFPQNQALPFRQQQVSPPQQYKDIEPIGRAATSFTPPTIGTLQNYQQPTIQAPQAQKQNSPEDQDRLIELIKENQKLKDKLYQIEHDIEGYRRRQEELEQRLQENENQSGQY